jgi:hypothetical protein
MVILNLPRMKKITLSLFILTALCVALFSCTKEVAKLQGPTDAEMLAWSQSSAGMFYYQGDSTNIIPPAAAQQNFHGPFKLRFNSYVKNALGSDGRLAQGHTLPDSSLIVKVMYSGNNPVGYSTMFKLNHSWTWYMYFISPPTVAQSVNASSTLCTSCHAGTGNRDNVLSFTYH